MRRCLPVVLALLVPALAQLSGCASGCGDEEPAARTPSTDPFAAPGGEGFGVRKQATPAPIARAVDAEQRPRRDPNDVNVVVYLEAEPDSGGAPLRVVFTVELDEKQQAAEYTWDFGDGHTASGVSRQVHTYEEPGEYEASVTVAIGGTREVDTVDIDVEETAFDVSMDADPDTGPPPLSVLFEVEVIDDLPGPFTYEWDFGDGTGSASNPAVHVYRIPGDYLAKVTVRNSAGQRGVEEFEINVEDDE